VESYTPAEKQIAWVLNIVAIVLAVLLVSGALIIYFNQGPSGHVLTQTPLDTNGVASLGLLMLLAWFAAADVRRFRTMTYVLIGGFAFDVVGALVLLRAPGSATASGQLIVGAVFSAVIAIVLLVMTLRARIIAPKWTPWLPDKPFTRWEQFMRILSLIVGVVSVVAAVAHYVVAYNPSASLATIFAASLLLNGSAVKIGMLGVCMLLAARDVRSYREFVTVFILGNAISLLTVILANFGMNRAGSVDFPLLATNSRMMMSGALLVDVTAVLGFIILKAIVDRSLLDHTRFFGPLHFRALEAISETLVEGGAAEKASPEQIVLRTDDYLASFPSKRLWLAKAAILGLEFMPLMTLEPPISFLSPAARREFIDRNFKRDILEKRGIYAFFAAIKFNFAVDVIEAMMRFNMQLSFIGYYSNPQVQADIGYKPFSQREEGKKAKPIRRYPALNVITPQNLRQRGTDVMTADVVIIGSGAGGSILAEQLADQGREVLVLEKGPYVPPDAFTEDEVTQISSLYADGALTISQSLRFTVIQGSCVGGSTVVNNAVCFDTPDEVLDMWNHPVGTNAGIDLPAFRAAQKAVRERMQIQSIKDSTKTRPWEEIINPGDKVINQGVANYLTQAASQMEYDVVSANIQDCVGCGYCNIGCKYGRKLSMLDEVLPKAQQKHGDKFRIVSEAEVDHLIMSGGRVKEIRAHMRDGRYLTIENPNTVIVSAGTVASSWLLMRSGIGKGELPVGQHLCFNMGSPLHGLWDQELNSYAGLQIAHYLRPGGNAGFVYETWYNPPIAQALAMPGWLDTHFQNMRNYNKMAAVGVLVGSEPTAHIKGALLLPGIPDIVYTPTEGDMEKLVNALCTLGKIMFEGGAKTVFASTRHYRSYDNDIGIFKAENVDSFESDLRQLVKTERDILLGTGHPQGGNRISKTRGKDGNSGGVVDPSFKVYGTDNLYVCDASVFPGATTVNPQLTVMTMAHYAAGLIH
jgi:choline dehydrogenase-like flavoprotein